MMTSDSFLGGKRLSAVRVIRVPLVVCALVAALWTGSATAVVISTGDGSGNTTAPPDDPGWANVGKNNDASGVYLGNRWVLTANHAGNPFRFVLDNGVYDDDDATFFQLTQADGSGLADLAMYRLMEDPGLPELTIATGNLAEGDEVAMIGRGLNRDPLKAFWVVDQSDPNNWQWTKETVLGDMNNDGKVNQGDVPLFVEALTNPDSYAAQFPYIDPLEFGDVDEDGSFDLGDVKPFIDLVSLVELKWNMAGYSTVSSQTKRWGTSLVGNPAGSGIQVILQSGGGETISYATEFQDVDGRAHAVSGDSGGAVFHKNGSQWELAGLILAAGSPDGYSYEPGPASHALPLYLSYFADLSEFVDQIDPLLHPMLGDMNANGQLDDGDIPLFDQALNAPESYAGQFPYIDVLEFGDIDGNGSLDESDLQPFLALFPPSTSFTPTTSLGSAVPEPATGVLAALGAICLWFVTGTRRRSGH